MSGRLVNRRGMLIGSAAVSSVAAFANSALAATTAEHIGPQGRFNNMPLDGFADAMKAGAKADGNADDQPALQHLFDGLKEGNVVSFAPGHYHLGRPLVLKTPRVTLLGHGAFFDHTIVLHARELRVTGLTVIGGPAEGFRILNGQGSHYESLSSHQNAGAGFIVGGVDGSAVAWCTFQSCSALRNKSDGWLLDGSRKKNWVDANLFSGCWSRANGGCGWRSLKRVHYNNWIGTQVEGNCVLQHDVPPIVLEGIDNFFYGGHVVDTNHCGTSVQFKKSRGNMIFGGRYFGGIEGGNYTQAVVMDAQQEKMIRARKTWRRDVEGENNDDDPSL